MNKILEGDFKDQAKKSLIGLAVLYTFVKFTKYVSWKLKNRRLLIL